MEHFPRNWVVARGTLFISETKMTNLKMRMEQQVIHMENDEIARKPHPRPKKFQKNVRYKTEKSKLNTLLSTHTRVYGFKVRTDLLNNKTKD